MKTNLRKFSDTISLKSTFYRKLKPRLILMLFLFFLTPKLSQSQSLKDGVYSIGYLNESLFRSGIIIGGEWKYKNWEKTKQKKKSKVLKKRTFIINPQIGLYNHYENHTGLILKADLTLKTNKNDSKWSHDWSLGLGMITQYNKGVTYVLDDNKEINEQKHTSRSYFNPTVSYSLERQINSMFSVYAKTGLGIKIPYNTWIVPVSLVVIGTKINLRNHE